MLNSTCRTILVCKLSQNVNFDGLTLLTALVLYSQSDYLNYSNRDSDWLIVACFMSVEHADDTDVRFGNKVCFEN